MKQFKVMVRLIVFLALSALILTGCNEGNVKGNQAKPSKIAAGGTVANASGKWTYLWTMDDQMEMVRNFKNDGTGSLISLDKDIHINGDASVKVGPPKNGLEAKIRMNLEPDQIRVWNGKDKILLNLYIPEGCNLNQCFFFIFKDQPFTWIDGFSYSDLQPGWNEVVVKMTDKMKNLPDGPKYVFGIAFYRMDGTNKSAINSSINLNGLAVGN